MAMLRQFAHRCTPRLLHDHTFGPLLLQIRGVKEDTGLVGLKVDPDARNNLRRKLEDVLEALKLHIPEDAEYRKQVEATIQHRLKAVVSEASDSDVEGNLENQLEMMIRHCNDELGLIPRMAEWKPWDVPADHKVDVYFKEPVPAPAPPQTPPPPPPPPKK